MAAFGMYGGNKFQDKRREKLLELLDAMIHGDESTLIFGFEALYAEAFYEGMKPFRDQLDLHNQCLLQNVIYQSDKIFETLKSKIDQRKKMGKVPIKEKTFDYLIRHDGD